MFPAIMFAMLYRCVLTYLNLIVINSADSAGKLPLFTAACRRGLMGQYNEKWLVSLVFVSKLLITIITAVDLVRVLIEQGNTTKN